MSHGQQHSLAHSMPSLAMLRCSILLFIACLLLTTLAFLPTFLLCTWMQKLKKKFSVVVFLGIFLLWIV